MDTTRADHFGFMGNTWISTPHLDELSRESVILEDLMTVVPTTLAAHTSLFTGLYPHRHGVPRNGFVVNPENTMLPELLERAGFDTAGFAASFALDRRFGFAQGFSEWDQEFEMGVGDSGADQDQRPADAVTDAVIRYLDRAGVAERLFLFVHYFDPHQPYTAPEPFAERYGVGGDPDLPPPWDFWQLDELSADELQTAREIARLYAAEVSFMDQEIGRLLSELRQRDILDRAVLLVTSDHGENLWAHPRYFDHGQTLFQSTLHSVGLLRLPHGELGGSRLPGVASTVDLLPTLLELVGLEPPQGLDGEVLSVRDSEVEHETRVRFAEASKPWQDVEEGVTWINERKARCVRRGRYKLIRTPYAGTEELYDLADDPGESRNLLDGGAKKPARSTLEVASELRRLLEIWSESAQPLPSNFDRRHRRETLERLRRLGYLQ